MSDPVPRENVEGVTDVLRRLMGRAWAEEYRAGAPLSSPADVIRLCSEVATAYVQEVV